MSKKKILLSVLAIMLVCSISVVGTLAFLTDESQLVTNTFKAADDLAASITLDESPAEKQEDGSYELDKDADKVPANEYIVAPGVDYPKDPAIHVIDKTETAAYVYLEVVDGTPATVTFGIDPMWQALEGVTGKNGGQIYVLTEAGKAVILTGTGTEDFNYNILVDQKITTTQAFDVEKTDDFTLKFYGYLAQASAADGAAAVFAACFKAA